MDRIWQWAWDRYGARYSWVICATAFPAFVQLYLTLTFVIVAYEESSRYVEAAAVSVVAALGLTIVMVLSVRRPFRLAEQWAAGHEVNRATALEHTYTWARGAVTRSVVGNAVWAAMLAVVVGAIAGATGSRLVQYAILGGAIGAANLLIAVHSTMEAALRPARLALAGDTGIGDSMPRSRPTFAAWSNVSMLAVALIYAVAGAMLST